MTDILLDRGNRDVIHKLAQNAGAHFSEAGFTTLVVKAETDERLAETVGLRLDVPSHLFEQLLLQATKTVQSRLMSLAPPETQREIRRVLALVSKEIGWQVTAPRDFTRARKSCWKSRGTARCTKRRWWNSQEAQIRRAGRRAFAAVFGAARGDRLPDGQPAQ